MTTHLSSFDSVASIPSPFSLGEPLHGLLVAGILNTLLSLEAVILLDIKVGAILLCGLFGNSLSKKLIKHE